jgi:hypothetical protein
MEMDRFNFKRCVDAKQVFPDGRAGFLPGLPDLQLYFFDHVIPTLEHVVANNNLALSRLFHIF